MTYARTPSGDARKSADAFNARERSAANAKAARLAIAGAPRIFMDFIASCASSMVLIWMNSVACGKSSWLTISILSSPSALMDVSPIFVAGTRWGQGGLRARELLWYLAW